MSLKAFHLVFIIVSFLFLAGFTYWAVDGYRAGGSEGLLAMGVVSALGLLSLPIYGTWFLRKLKNESYL